MKHPASPDPIRFTMHASKTNVRVGEEVEITVTAQLLDISPQSMFFFEQQKAFSIKVLMPAGFEQTGGTYHDYIGADLAGRPGEVVRYTIHGHLAQPLKSALFTLLRGPKDGTPESLFEKKQTIVLHVADAFVTNQVQARQTAVPDSVCSIKQKTVKLSISQPVSGVTSLTVVVIKGNLSDYEYSIDSLSFRKHNVLKTKRTNGYIFIRQVENTACYIKIPYEIPPLENPVQQPNQPGKKPSLPKKVSITTLSGGGCETASFVNVTTQGSTTICTNGCSCVPGSASLYADGCVGSITWYRNGTAMAVPNTTQTLLVMEGGAYSVECATAECPDNPIPSDYPLSITEIQTCPPVVTDPCTFTYTGPANQNVTCNTSVFLQGFCSGNCDGLQYKWSGPGLNAEGESSESVTVTPTSDGAYTYNLSVSKAGCADAASFAVTVTATCSVTHTQACPSPNASITQLNRNCDDRSLTIVSFNSGSTVYVRRNGQAYDHYTVNSSQPATTFSGLPDNSIYQVGIQAPGEETCWRDDLISFPCPSATCSFAITGLSNDMVASCGAPISFGGCQGGDCGSVTASWAGQDVGGQTSLPLAINAPPPPQRAVIPTRSR